VKKEEVAKEGVFFIAEKIGGAENAEVILDFRW
jgi:hypothetical protein